LQIWVVIKAFTEAFMEITADITADIAADITVKVLIEAANGIELNLNYSSGDL
jgi:hypothetical protein